MIDFNTLLTFSHTYCVAICAVLVPFNLLTTLLTLGLTGTARPKLQVWCSISCAIVGSGLMVLHVLTWFVIGVVMLPTFILLALAVSCLSINAWALLHPQSLRNVLRELGHFARLSLQTLAQRVAAL